MPSDERAPHPTGLAKNAYVTYSRGGGPSHTLTKDIGDRLVNAVAEYPTITSACHACGVSVSTVNHWLRRAAQAGAHQELVEWAQRFIKAFADHGKDKLKEFDEAVRMGNPAAGHLLKYINGRYQDRGGADLEAMMTQGPKKSDDLEQLLLEPTPRLRALLKKTGWERKDDWNHAGVVQTTGIEKSGD